MLKKIKDGDKKDKYRVEVMGFDYNTKMGSIESGGSGDLLTPKRQVMQHLQASIVSRPCR